VAAAAANLGFIGLRRRLLALQSSASPLFAQSGRLFSLAGRYCSGALFVIIVMA